MSGPRAHAVADEVFLTKSKKKLSAAKGYSAHYGEFLAEGRPVDDGVALVFCAPKSYTGEDMVEFSCHGSVWIASAIVDACVAAGALPAGPGEFTRRAFENGKLDLSAAEAVAELIAADGLRAARAAHGRAQGALGRRVDAVGEALTVSAASLAAWSDYPEEEDVPPVTREGLRQTWEKAHEDLKKIINTYKHGRIIQNGAGLAIVGSPNVGKSTLMNLLAGAERSIVTAIAGTTRDVVEAGVMIEGVFIRLLDTAGIRPTADPVERIGVERAQKTMDAADLILAVFDRSRPLTGEDEILLEKLKGRTHVIVLNKTDLPAQVSPEQLGPCVEISAITGEGGGALRARIARELGLSGIDNGALVTSSRQYDCLLRADAALAEALSALSSGVTLDAVSVLLDDAIAPLAQLTGRSVTEAVLEQVFSRFCIGK
jgi:tRNA modification GTPase